MKNIISLLNLALPIILRAVDLWVGILIGCVLVTITTADQRVVFFANLAVVVFLVMLYLIGRVLASDDIDSGDQRTTINGLRVGDHVEITYATGQVQIAVIEAISPDGKECVVMYKDWSSDTGLTVDCQDLRLV